MGKPPGPRPPLQGQAGVPESWPRREASARRPRRYTHTETLRSTERNMPHAPLTPTHTQSKGTHAGPRPSPQAAIEGTDLPLAGPSGVCSPPISLQRTPREGALASLSGMRVPACMHTRVWSCQPHLPLTHLFIPTPRWGRGCRRVGRQSLPAFSSLSGLPSGSWGRSPHPTPG